MNRMTIFKRVSPLLMLFSAQAMALPFQSLDPHSFALGGTGVASGTISNASFMNPALLAVAKEDEDFSVDGSIVLDLYDPGEVRREIDAYKDNNLEANFDQALNALKNAGGSATAADYQAVATSTQALKNQLQKLSNMTVQGDVLGGVTIGIPGRKFGASLISDLRLIAGGVLNVSDSDLAQLQAIVTAAQSQTLNKDTYDIFRSKDLSSTLAARGALISEVGISLAREIDIAGGNVSLGVTPKYVRIDTFDYLVGVNSASFSSSKGKLSYRNFNMDLGLAKDYGNGWKSGFTVKDVISKSYDTVIPGHQIKIEPQARVGVSHSTKWTTVALDVDLTENAPVGYESKTRYAMLGAELNFFETVQVRIGYRHNMSDSTTDMPTAGLGFSPFGSGHVDFAVAGNQDEKAAALQLGFRF